MVPPAVLLPWVVLALLGVEGGSASKQEGKDCSGTLGRGQISRGAGGRANGGAPLQLVLLLLLVLQSSSEALPDLGPVPTAESELLVGIQSLLLSSEAGQRLVWVLSAHASEVPQLPDRHTPLSCVRRALDNISCW